MVGQKSRRNSGFLPPLAADGVYDHNCAVPSTVRHAGRAQERLAHEVSAGLFRQKTSQSKAWLTWLSLLPLAALEITKIRSCETHEAGMSLRAVRFLSLGELTLAHSLGGPGPLNTKNKNRAPKARFCGQNSPKRAGFHAFWSPKQQCNHPITPSTDPTDPARRPPDRPTGPPPPTPWTHPWH